MMNHDDEDDVNEMLVVEPGLETVDAEKVRFNLLFREMFLANNHSTSEGTLGFLCRKVYEIEDTKQGALEHKVN